MDVGVVVGIGLVGFGFDFVISGGCCVVVGVGG